MIVASSPIPPRGTPLHSTYPKFVFWVRTTSYLPKRKVLGTLSGAGFEGLRAPGKGTMNTMAIRFALPFALVLGGCAATTTDTFDVAPGTSDAVVLAAEQAVAEWCTQSNGAHCITLRYNDPCWGDDSCQAMLREAPAVLDGAHAGAALVMHRRTGINAAWIETLVVHTGVDYVAWVNATCSGRGASAADGTCWTEHLRRDLLHEIGHHFCGLQHDSRPGHVMNANEWGVPDSLSAADATCQEAP